MEARGHLTPRSEGIIAGFSFGNSPLGIGFRAVTTQATRSSKVLTRGYFAPQRSHRTLVPMNHADAMRTLFPDLDVDARQKLALTATTLKTAYRRQMLRFHPDRQADARVLHMRTRKHAPSKPHLKSSKTTYRTAPGHLLRSHRKQQRGHAGPANQTHEIWRFPGFRGHRNRESLNLALREQHHRRPSFGATAVTLGYLGPMNSPGGWSIRQSIRVVWAIS